MNWIRRNWFNAVADIAAGNIAHTHISTCYKT